MHATLQRTGSRRFFSSLASYDVGGIITGPSVFLEEVRFTTIFFFRALAKMPPTPFFREASCLMLPFPSSSSVYEGVSSRAFGL